MLNLNSFIPVLQNDNSNTKVIENSLDGIGLAFAAIGVAIFLTALVPQFIAVYKTKDVRGISEKMFLYHTLTAFFFAFAAFLFIFDSFFFIKNNVIGVNGILFFVLNVIGFIGNYYIYSLKVKSRSQE